VGRSCFAPLVAGRLTAFTVGVTVDSEDDMATCPVDQRFDPLSPEFLADPYPELARVREVGPVFFSPVLDRWVVTRYADIETVLGDPETFSAVEAQKTLYPLCPEAAEILAGLALTPTLSNCDPPAHSRYRQVLARALSPSRMAKLEPAIRRRTGELIDALVPGLDGGCRVEVMSRLCYPLPALTVFTLIGFPLDDADRIKAWCEDKLEVNWGRPSVEQQVRSARSMVAFLGYCADFVRSRRTEPHDDLTSDLIADERGLSDQEIASMIFALSFAGHETTTNLLGNALRALLSRPELWAEVCADRALIPGAVEETLRYDTSVPSWRRVTTRPAALGDVPLPAGARLVLSFAAANHEPDRFPEPDRFDVRRPEARKQLSFGKGIHFCLGAGLARIEGQIVLDLIADRLPGLRMADQAMVFPANISFRGPKELWVRIPDGA
jgi:cytochrome P450